MKRLRRFDLLAADLHCVLSDQETSQSFYTRFQNKNEMNRALGPLLWTYRLNCEDGEISEMTLSSRHRIRNSNPGGLSRSTLPLGHGGSSKFWVLRTDVKKLVCFFQTAESGNRTPNSSVEGSGANHYPGATTHKVPKWVKFNHLIQRIVWFWNTLGCNYYILLYMYPPPPPPKPMSETAL